MEVLVYLILGGVTFVVYVFVAKMIFEQYRRSKGVAAFFWFMLFVGTLSFLFGGSSSSSQSGQTSGGGCDNGFDFWSGGDCSWSGSSSDSCGSGCDDDD